MVTPFKMSKALIRKTWMATFSSWAKAALRSSSGTSCWTSCWTCWKIHWDIRLDYMWLYVIILYTQKSWTHPETGRLLFPVTPDGSTELLVSSAALIIAASQWWSFSIQKQRRQRDAASEMTKPLRQWARCQWGKPQWAASWIKMTRTIRIHWILRISCTIWGLWFGDLFQWIIVNRIGSSCLWAFDNLQHLPWPRWPGDQTKQKVCPAR